MKVLVDGAPVNQPGGFYDFGSLTTDNVERIEVLRGPASVLYGSDAITGVVQIVTRRGGEGLQLSAAGEGGSFGSARWEASALGGGEAVDWSASLSRITSDGTYEFNNDYRNTVASGRLGAAVGDRTKVGLSGHYYDALYHFPTDFTGAPVDHNQFTTDETATFALDATQRLSETVDGRLLLARSDIENGYENPADPPRQPATGSSDQVSTDRTSADARLRLRLPAGFEGFAGGSFEAQRQGVTDATEGRDNWGVSPRPRRCPCPVCSSRPADGWTTTSDSEPSGPGGRRRSRSPHPPPGSVRRRAPASRSRASSRIFDTPFSIGNPDLRPERTVSYEAGIEQDLFGGVALVGLTGFVQHFRDLIQFTFVTPEPGGPNYFNVAAANANGLEAVLQAGTAALRGTLSYTHLWTEVTDAGFDAGDAATFVEGERLLRRPDDAVSAMVETTVAERARLGATLTWSGPRDDILFGQFPEPNQRVKLPSYTTLDLSSVLTVLPARRGRPGLDLTARVENVFDEQYEQSVGFPARGRGVFVGVSTVVH